MSSCNPFCCCVWQHSHVNGLYPAAVKSRFPRIPFIRLSALSSTRGCMNLGSPLYVPWDPPLHSGGRSINHDPSWMS